MTPSAHAVTSFIRGLGYHVAAGLPWPLATVLLAGIAVIWRRR